MKYTNDMNKHQMNLYESKMKEKEQIISLLNKRIEQPSPNKELERLKVQLESMERER